MKIGNTEIKNGLFLAPMAGYTDRAMRLICKKYGAEYTVTEMVSAKAVVYEDKKTHALARIREDEGPVAIQIFGSEPDIMAEAAARLLSSDSGRLAVAIDINMGCPVKKIVSNGEGSALMRDPRKIEAIVSSVVRFSRVPVTVKIRAGVAEGAVNATECALAAEAGGASAICIHGRFASQMYGGKADRKIIKNVKQALQIPLIANGDITNADEALSMLSETNADGIAIGRGAVGNPFIFSEILSALEGKEPRAITLEEKIHTAISQLKLAVEDKGERCAIPEARKQIALYLRGFRCAARIRSEINLSQSFAEVEEALRSALAQSSDIY